MRAIPEFVSHYHIERNHQGKGNVLLFPSPDYVPNKNGGAIEQRVRLDGMLNYYYRAVA